MRQNKRPHPIYHDSFFPVILIATGIFLTRYMPPWWAIRWLKMLEKSVQEAYTDFITQTR